MPQEDQQPVVHIRPQLADFLGVAGKLPLLPTAVDGPKHGNQRGRGGQGNALAHGIIHQAGVGFEGGGQELVAGYEHHHEIQGAVHLAAVLLAGQVGYLGFQVDGVAFPSGVGGGFIGGGLGFQGGGDGGFGVDDHRPALRQADDQIGPVIANRGLFGEVAVGGHIRHFHHFPQLHFPPMADLPHIGKGGG